MDTLGIIAILIALAAAVFAGLTWWNSKQTMRHHIIEDIRKDYRSLEMHHAVKTLWQFYKDCNKDEKDFVGEYLKILDKDEKKLSNLEEHQRVEAERSTIHYQRRLVSHFYQYVAALYDNKILTGDIVFKTWAEEDLRIIPNIIIPIEIKLHEIIHTQPLQPINVENLPSSLSVLYKLYGDSMRADYQRGKNHA